MANKTRWYEVGDKILLLCFHLSDLQSLSESSPPFLVSILVSLLHCLQIFFFPHGDDVQLLAGWQRSYSVTMRTPFFIFTFLRTTLTRGNDGEKYQPLLYLMSVWDPLMYRLWLCSLSTKYPVVSGAAIPTINLTPPYTHLPLLANPASLFSI